MQIEENLLYGNGDKAYVQSAAKGIASLGKPKSAMAKEMTIDSVAVLLDLVDKIYVDFAYQRKGGDRGQAGWDRKKQEAYINSFFDDKTSGILMFAELESSLARGENDGDTDQEWYKDIKEAVASGKIVASIDGWNRTWSILLFFNNEIPYHGRFFKDMTRSEQVKLLNTKVIYATYYNTSGPEQCKLFCEQNDGTPITAQRQRSASHAPKAKQIRDMADCEWFKDFIYATNNAKQKDVDDLTVEERLAKYILIRETGFTKNSTTGELDAWYKIPELNEKNFKQVKNAWKVAAHALKQMIKDAKGKDLGFKKRTNAGFLHMFVDFFYIIDQMGFDVPKQQSHELAKFFMETHAAMHQKSSRQSFTEDERKEHSYEHKLSQAHQYHAAARWGQYLWGNVFLANKDEFLKKNQITKKRKSADEFKDRNLALKLWAKQGGEDRNGQPIDILDIYFSKTEIDHIKSVHDGGTADAENNAELMSRSANRAKGSKSNEPHDFSKTQMPSHGNDVESRETETSV